ncbi:hypothetical protein [Streptomyces sp. NPDC019937]|uniref:hypothetical protein n=1 Tax=Streptomyces sp. NPDC019937 TaxID=3154787 RepID=UPI0034079BCA
MPVAVPTVRADLVLATGVATGVGGLHAPAAMSILTTSYPEGPQRDKALLVFAGVGAREGQRRRSWMSSFSAI